VRGLVAPLGADRVLSEDITTLAGAVAEGRFAAGAGGGARLEPEAATL
jgi:hypothetical protein